MSMDIVHGKNHKGYPDPTAATAIANVERQIKGARSRRTGELFESMIDVGLTWYKVRGDAFVEKTPEPMKPIRPPNAQGQFLACYTKSGQPDFKGTIAGGRWKIEAMESIYSYLVNELAEIPDRDKITIIA